ncbi:MAG: GNAT family N-acetyltransferase [Pseudomonadota bacterium]
MSLRDTWEDVISGMHHRRFYHLWEWHHSYLKCLDPDPQSLLYFLFTKGKTPVAIFPLRFTKLSLRGMQLKTLAFPSHDHMSICDIICHRDALHLPLFQLLAKHLRNQGEPWDVIHLPHLLEDDGAITALQQHPPSAYLLRHEGGCDFINVTGTYEAYTLGLSKKFRTNLKRTRHHLNQLPGVRITFAQDGPELEDGLDAFMDVEASGWKGPQGIGTAIKLQPRLVCFYRELTRAFSVSGKVAINTLNVDKKCVAAQFWLLVDDTVYMLKTGYNEAFKHYAPGKQLVHLFIQRCMEDGTVKSINFVTNREWHADWRPKTLDKSELYIFNTSLAGIICFVLMKCHWVLKQNYRKHIKSRIPKRISERAQFQNTSRYNLINIKRIFTFHNDVLNGLKTHGFSGSARHVVNRINEIWHEWRLGIRTRGWVIADKQFCYDYEPTDYRTFHQVIRNLNIKPGKDVFLDYGSGMGRAVISAATYPFRKTIGVEMLSELIIIAEHNVRQAHAKLKCKDIQLIKADAETYLPPKDVTVFYLFNPFDGPILSSVLNNILISLLDSPRNIYLVYMPPAGSQQILPDDCKWLIRYRQFQSYTYLNQIVLVYKNNPEFNFEKI